MKQLLKFSATWCGPCKALAGSMKHVDFGDIEVKEIDIDQNQDLVGKYLIRGVPTLVLLDDGKEVARKSGVMMADEIEQFINANPLSES